ncbi:MAG: hypothetical protein ACRCUJ_00665, partial [Phocaeicola sp.]
LQNGLYIIRSQQKGSPKFRAIRAQNELPSFDPILLGNHDKGGDMERDRARESVNLHSLPAPFKENSLEVLFKK